MQYLRHSQFNYSALFRTFAEIKNDYDMQRKSIILLVATMCLAACGGNGSADVAKVEDTESGVTMDGINTMSDFNLDGDVEVDGRKYTYEFAFRSDESLPVVTNAEGFRYHDNRVKLLISQGQQVVYEHTFTKESFRDLVPAKDYQRSVLAGFNRNYMKEGQHDRFYFVAVVGDPDENGDISHTIGIAVDTHGGMSTELIKNVDTDTSPTSGAANSDPDEDAA